MKALTLIQPWASAIERHLKVYETRSWPTQYRGMLAIHAGRSTEYVTLVRDHSRLPLGQIIAVATLTDCLLINKEVAAAQSDLELAWGDWSLGRYAWKLENVQPVTQGDLGERLDVRGYQRIWTVPDPLGAALELWYLAR